MKTKLILTAPDHKIEALNRENLGAMLFINTAPDASLDKLGWSGAEARSMPLDLYYYLHNAGINKELFTGAIKFMVANDSDLIEFSSSELCVWLNSENSLWFEGDDFIEYVGNRVIDEEEEKIIMANAGMDFYDSEYKEAAKEYTERYWKDHAANFIIENLNKGVYS